MKLKPYSIEFFIATLNKMLYPTENLLSQTTSMSLALSWENQEPDISCSRQKCEIQ